MLTRAFLQKNLHRAGYSLPFLQPFLRDLITIIPSLLSEGRPSIGIYEHPICTQNDYDLLWKYLGRKPEIMVGRLPYRVGIDSAILLITPSLGNTYFSKVTLICIARKDTPMDELEIKINAIGDVFRRHNISFAGVAYQDSLPEFLIYEIMRIGIVIGGKEPVTNVNAVSDSAVYIGELPGMITKAEGIPTGEWNPFRHYLDSQVAEFIAKNDYPSALSIPSANPYIIPYLHILHHYEEHGETEKTEKMRISIYYLMSGFPPTSEVVDNFRRTWKTGSSYPPLTDLGFRELLRLRKWLVPLKENELPVFSWPPFPHFSMERVELEMNDFFWNIRGFGEFKHKYAWVVLVWAAFSGIIGPGTRIIAPDVLKMKHTCRDLLPLIMDAIRTGADSLVPGDHRHGSIQAIQNRLFFSAEPFAILGQGHKYSVELFDVIKKKTLIDDSDLVDKDKT